jgi:hypothetical protein
MIKEFGAHVHLALTLNHFHANQKKNVRGLIYPEFPETYGQRAQLPSLPSADGAVLPFSQRVITLILNFAEGTH